MIYPSKIQQQLKDVEQLVKSWSINIQFEKVLQWIMQFDNEDFDLAIRILKNLNVIGYKELNNGLEVAYSKLERKAIEAGTKINHKNTIFAGVGEGGKSGNMISYNFRLTNNLSEDNFIIDEKTIEYLEAGEIKNIVLVDDILSSGTSVLNEVKKLTEKTIPLNVENIFVLTAVGMKEGIKRVKEETKGKVHVFSAFQYDISDTVVSLDSKFYDGIPYQDRIKVKEQLEYYGSTVYPKGKLGYRGIGGLIVFYYNTPNTTIPLIWGTRNSWIPLFKRATKINGISAHYKDFDKALSKKVKAHKTQEKNLEELTIYVDGRIQEMFFETQISSLKKTLNVKKINVISLGGYNSKKLIDNLSKLANTKFIFVVEKNPNEPPGYTKRVKDNLGENSYVYSKPFVYYLDIESLYSDEEIIIYLPKKEDIEEVNLLEKMRLIERKLIRRIFMSRRDLLAPILLKHGKVKEIEEFQQEISNKLKGNT